MTGKQQTILNAKMLFNAFGMGTPFRAQRAKVVMFGFTPNEIFHLQMFGLVKRKDSRYCYFVKNPYFIEGCTIPLFSKKTTT